MAGFPLGCMFHRLRSGRAPRKLFVVDCDSGNGNRHRDARLGDVPDTPEK